MLYPALKDAYEKIQNRIQMYKKAARTGRIILNFGFAWSILSIFLVLVFLLLEIKLFLDISVLWMISLSVGLFFMLLGAQINKFKGIVTPMLLAEENAFLKIYKALVHFDNYQKENFLTSKGAALKLLAKVGRSMRSLVWRTGDLKIIREIVGNELELFKENYEKRLLPTLEKGNKKDFDRGIALLVKFAFYLLHPTIKTLRELNEDMEKLPRSTARIGFIPRVTIEIKTRPIAKHTVALVLSILASIIAFYIGMAVHASIDASYYASIGTFTVLFGAYIAVALKK